MIECKLCHKFYKSITNTHLKKAHAITSSEYLKMFPESIMSSMQGMTYEEIYGSTKAGDLKKQHSESHRGVKHSEETRQKQRESMLGKNKGLWGTRFCVNEECGEIFECPINSTRKYCSPECYWKDMRGKALPHSTLEELRKITKTRKGKTYEEYYGKEKAAGVKRNQSNAIAKMELRFCVVN